ncbi:hypothetical protein EJ02DRAFT_253261 [Clathrospora elynae]|uniref:Uncharacterized protein n=1 Tax=Clathrospora elynae TaxID=706981 RepID=A0A6A5SJP9_9PLEO|nr:hypothetical protein EJ02DRAFT_253261 [Clathrospora elynae]
MCNVVHLQFSCKHTLRLRRSRCKGTKHKTTRNSVKAACTAESFLTICLRTDCSFCQHMIWQRIWDYKLLRANRFLAKLTEKRMSGVNEVTTLVQDLVAQYQVAPWDARNMFVHTPKPFVARVGISDHKKAHSPLLQEVRPEDVEEAGGKCWAEMREEDYNGNYVASTDPIHPVNTDYSHPHDDDDGNWMVNHLSPEELESAGEAVQLDFDGSGWSWGNESSDVDVPSANREHMDEDFNHEPEQWKAIANPEEGKGHIAWGPDAEVPSPAATLSMDSTSTEENVQQEQIEPIIQAFWTYVNNNPKTDEQYRHPTNDLSDLLHELGISPESTHVSSDTTSPLATPTKTRHQWTDGPSDGPPTSPPRCPTPPSPNSTRSMFDKQRRDLEERKEIENDLTKFYRDWLVVSRQEVRAFEAGAKFVPEPEMPKAKGGGAI